MVVLGPGGLVGPEPLEHLPKAVQRTSPPDRRIPNPPIIRAPAPPVNRRDDAPRGMSGGLKTALRRTSRSIDNRSISCGFGFVSRGVSTGCGRMPDWHSQGTPFGTIRDRNPPSGGRPSPEIEAFRALGQRGHGRSSGRRCLEHTSNARSAPAGHRLQGAAGLAIGDGAIVAEGDRQGGGGDRQRQRQEAARRRGGPARPSRRGGPCRSACGPAPCGGRSRPRTAGPGPGACPGRGRGRPRPGRDRARRVRPCLRRFAPPVSRFARRSARAGRRPGRSARRGTPWACPAGPAPAASARASTRPWPPARSQALPAGDQPFAALLRPSQAAGDDGGRARELAAQLLGIGAAVGLPAEGGAARRTVAEGRLVIATALDQEAPDGHLLHEPLVILAFGPQRGREGGDAGGEGSGLDGGGERLGGQAVRQGIAARGVLALGGLRTGRLEGVRPIRFKLGRAGHDGTLQ